MDWKKKIWNWYLIAIDIQKNKKKVKLVIEFTNYVIFGEINLLHVESIMEKDSLTYGRK